MHYNQRGIKTISGKADYKKNIKTTEMQRKNNLWDILGFLAPLYFESIFYFCWNIGPFYFIIFNVGYIPGIIFLHYLFGEFIVKF